MHEDCIVEAEVEVNSHQGSGRTADNQPLVTVELIRPDPNAAASNVVRARTTDLRPLIPKVSEDNAHCLRCESGMLAAAAG